MKKVLLILGIITLFTGCSVEYNLDIDDKFDEQIIVIPNNSNLYNTLVKSYQFASFSESQNVIDSQTEIGKNYKIYYQKASDNNIEYTYKFTDEDYNDSNAIKSCYEFVSLVKENGTIKISTSNEFKCLKTYDELDSVKINITTKYEVTQHNADTVKDKTYTWNITRNNADDKPIIFVYNKEKKSMTLMDYLSNNIFVTIILASAILAVGAVAIVLKLRSNKVNKI